MLKGGVREEKCRLETRERGIWSGRVEALAKAGELWSVRAEQRTNPTKQKDWRTFRFLSGQL